MYDYDRLQITELRGVRYGLIAVIRGPDATDRHRSKTGIQRQRRELPLSEVERKQFGEKRTLSWANVGGGVSAVDTVLSRGWFTIESALHPMPDEQEL